MDQFFKDSRILKRLRESSLADYLRILAMQLEAEGYNAEAACKMIKIGDEFGVWLCRRQVSADRITTNHSDAFLRCRKKTRRPKFSDGPALKRLLRIIEEQKGCAIVFAKSQDPVDVLCDEFAEYLANVRGLAARSVSTYRFIAHRFLTQRFAGETVNLSNLEGRDVIRFITDQAGVLGSKRISLTICALRSFLRFARMQNYINRNLATAVPNVAKRSVKTVPKQLAQEQVISVLDSCNRSSKNGRRDYAIILLLARLGLRAGEVASLTLDDIDWHEASITICGKSRRVSKLPIPSDVGEALADYVKNDRPLTASRSMFFRVNAPCTALDKPTAIAHVVERALSRANIVSSSSGAHLFRHTLAGQMRRQGASLSEIGEILRHHSPQSTMIYAGVDLVSLRKLAAPWPGGKQ